MLTVIGNTEPPLDKIQKNEPSYVFLQTIPSLKSFVADLCLFRQPKILWKNFYVRKMTCNNPKLDLVNTNAYIKFGEICLVVLKILSGNKISA